ncbi:MAG: mechanosensitive ion channel family protein [Verrucomicrobiota bacterium JB024]|nr:mechanosensitive ion channel family protein [Verrucomicrobiota bacterium JB024]
MKALLMTFALSFGLSGWLCAQEVEDPHHYKEHSDAYEREHLDVPHYVDQHLDSRKLLDNMSNFASDTRSPRATLESFFYLIDSYYTLINADGVTWQNQDDLNNIALELADLFDMEDIPVNFQGDAAIEASVYMAEYLSRREMPPLDEVPDEGEMAASIKAGKLPVYRIPGTPIEITRINHGDLEGHYLFVNTMLSDAKSLYYQAENYPYLSDQFQGFYELYFLTPGPMIPVEYVRRLPHWMTVEVYEQTIWQWVLTLLGFGLLIGIVYGLARLIRRISQYWQPLAVNTAHLSLPVVTIALTRVLIYMLDDQVFLTGDAWKFIIMISDVIVLVSYITIIIVLGSIVASAIVKSRHLQERRIDQYLIRLGIRILSIVIAIGVMVQGLQRLGFSGATLLAGASVSGLAVALAAQSTLKNVFGSIMLVLDRPFVIGNRVRIKGFDGTVEEIGLRSTRLRTLDGHMVSIPNDELSCSDIENVSSRPYIKRAFTISLTYGTPPEKIFEAMDIVKEILAPPAPEEAVSGEELAGQTVEEKQKTPPSNAPIHQPDFPPRVFFNELALDSLNLIVIYWYHPADYWGYMEHATWVNSELIRRFNAAGIDFAFPTQTIMLENVSGDPARSSETPPAQPPASPSPEPAGV